MNNSEGAIPVQEIDLGQLKRAIDMIFDHIQNDLKITKVKLDHDYYAYMDLEEKFEIMSDRKNINFLDNLDNLDIAVGDLYEDWEFLENMLTNNSAVALMFDHVAPILRYIGYKALKQSGNK